MDRRTDRRWGMGGGQAERNLVKKLTCWFICVDSIPQIWKVDEGVIVHLEQVVGCRPGTEVL